MTRRTVFMTTFDTSSLYDYNRDMDINNTSVILASSSKYRQKLLADFGLEVHAIAPDFDEEAHKDTASAPQQLCEKLSLMKAQSLLAKFPDSVIIGADQLVHFEGQVLGKGGTPEKASEQLLALSGKSHELITSLSVVFKDRISTQTNVTRLTMRSLTADQARAFVARDQAWDCAGSYKLELSGAALFSKIETSDHSAIIGLPLTLLTDILLDFGFTLPFFSFTTKDA